MKVASILNHLRVYALAYIVILAHFPGGFIANIAIIVSSLWAFGYFIIRKKVDLYLLFLLLIPSICFTPQSDPDSVSSSFLLQNFQNVVVVGPLAVTVRLALALAIPFRMVMQFGRLRTLPLIGLWILCVLLSIGGLYLSFASGNENPSGLTVGFRIALSMGVILMPGCVADKQIFYRYFDQIILASVILLIMGLLNNHWVFITFGFIPYVWARTRSKILIFLFLLFSVRQLTSLEVTITILGVLFVSYVFYLLINYSSGIRRLFIRPFFFLLLILSPIVLTIYTVQLPDNKKNYDFTSVSGYARFKLIGDRKPIWDASYDQIVKTSFFVVPAGTTLVVYFDFIDKWVAWEPGSHNIFLQIGIQIGGFGMVLLTIFMVYGLYRAGKSVLTDVDMLLFYSFLSVYIVYGLTGNSLIYDGVGFLFWLLISQFYKVLDAPPESHEVLLTKGDQH